MKIKISKIYYLVCALVVLALGIFTNVQFLPDTEVVDGFSAQIIHIVALIQDDAIFDAAEESWLVFVHLLRFIVVSPFSLFEAVAGPAGSLSLLLLLLMPLAHVPGKSRKSIIAILPLFLPLFFSGRSVLVAIGVGYIVMYQIEKRGSWMIALGVLFSNLSSASVLMSLLILIFGDIPGTHPRSHWKWPKIASILFLFLSLAISVQIKFFGFVEGGAGYASAVESSENIFLAILSRSTLIVSFLEGQSRFLFYFAFFVISFFKLTTLMVGSRFRVARRILLCCMPGLFLEGSGALGMSFPIVWLLAGIEQQEINRQDSLTIK